MIKLTAIDAQFQFSPVSFYKTLNYSNKLATLRYWVSCWEVTC